MPAKRTSVTRVDLSEIPPYKPGRRPEEVAATLGIDQIIKLSSNELPFPPAPGVIRALAEASSQMHRYPDLAATKLREALGVRLGVDPARIVTDCGSVAVCHQLAIAACLPGDEIIFGWRSFEAYPMMAYRVGAREIRVPNTADHRLDTQAIAAAVTERTRLIFLCAPNNPTGAMIQHDELTALLKAVPKTVLVAIDEAYHEFVSDPQAPNGIEISNQYPNVVALRTFSKAWGLAGLRIGYGVASPETAEVLHTIRTTFSVSLAAQAAACAALEEEAWMRKNVATIVAERSRIIKELRNWLPGIPDSQANFVWLPLAEHSKTFAEAAEAQGVILRPFEGEGVRATIGTPAENDRFLAVTEKLLTM